MLGDPVALHRSVRHAAATYGVGFAPYFAALALWAGAMLTFMVFKPLVRPRPVAPWATLGTLVLTALAFTAIVQLLGAALGTPGRLAALALLMLQLTSSGETYPVQTSPGFFRALHPWMPMTYVIDALRRLTVGGSSDRVWMAVGVLCGLAAGALAAPGPRRLLHLPVCWVRG